MRWLLLLSVIIAVAIWTEVSDTHQQMIPKDDQPNVASFVVVGGYDEPSNDSVTGAFTTTAKTQAACHSQADVDRLIQFSEVRDGHGISTFLAQRIAAKECVILMLGDRVRIDATADLSNRVCVLPQGQGTCYWTLSSGINLEPRSGQ
jgi:hypothetical protein